MEFDILTKKIKIEEKRIKFVKTWLETQLIKNIQVFLDFFNFYRRFIKNFNKITISYTLILKTILLNNSPEISGFIDKVASNNIAKIVGIGDNEVVDRDIKNPSTSTSLAKFKKSNLAKNRKSNFSKTNFLDRIFLFLRQKKLLFIYKKLLLKL